MSSQPTHHARTQTSLVFQSDLVRYEQVYSLNNFSFLDSNEIVNIISAILNEILKKTDRLSTSTHTIFHSKYPPRVTISTYISKIIENFKCSQECLILAMIYIDRLTTSKAKLVMKSSNIHRLMITAIMLAAKFNDDSCFKNEYYAKVGGIPAREMNQLEAEFLDAIGYNLEQLVSQGRPLLSL